MHTWDIYFYIYICPEVPEKNRTMNHMNFYLITLFHLILTITFASCNSSRIERDNCCQRERSGGKDIPPIRNRMHQVKLHQTACMANRVKWIRCKLQVIVNFSARFGEKNDVWTWSKHSMINCIWKHCMQSTSEKKRILYGKTQWKWTPWLQEQQTAADTHHMSSHSTLFQPGQTPPAEPTWCSFEKKGWFSGSILVFGGVSEISDLILPSLPSLLTDSPHVQWFCEP